MEKGEKGIGSAAVATTGTMLSDHSAIDASNRASSSIPKPPLIPSGFLVLAIGSAPVSPNHPFFSLFLFFPDILFINLSPFFSPFIHSFLCDCCFTYSCSGGVLPCPPRNLFLYVFLGALENVGVKWNWEI